MVDTTTSGVATMNQQLQARPRIWAVGGGKGGVGKTGVASSVAVVLAQSGFRCVAVDADFGAANLHSMLGVPEPRGSLRQFLAGEAPTLEEIACDTPIPGLRLVSGSRAAVNAANLSHPRRQKLLRHLRKLDADDVVVDLGAGSSFNVIDFFAAADLPLAVVTPEPTAIENTYHFIKASWFRAMRPAVQRPEVREAVRFALGQTPHTIPPHLLIEAVREVDASAAAALRRSVEAFRPGLVVNRATSAPERALGEHIAAGCRKSLGARVRAVGGLAHDKAVAHAVERCQPVLESFPDSTFAKDVYAMAEQMLLPDSAQREHPTSEGRGRIRRALGFDREWVEKHRRIRHLADLAGAD
jgi:flagellar biosynthesis protein FlhG